MTAVHVLALAGVAVARDVELAGTAFRAGRAVGRHQQPLAFQALQVERLAVQRRQFQVARGRHGALRRHQRAVIAGIRRPPLRVHVHHEGGHDRRQRTQEHQQHGHQ
ncbi:hypothetical protein G6F46_015034 [Rhizopus delemar]|nr:hypothetical protein G6F46_015034 [Rhizopus delemar]